MAAENALKVVRQIQALADGPKTPEMRECFPQICSSLVYFLDHPDSRVRLGAARTLLNLSRSYPEDTPKLDLTRARNALERWKAAMAAGSNEDDSIDLTITLQELLGEVDRPDLQEQDASEKTVHAGNVVADVGEATSGPPFTDRRGEIILKINAETDGQVKGAILEKAVQISGVVSVTFEGDLIIVSTRTQSMASDPAFSQDLLDFVRKQGLMNAAFFGGNVRTGLASSGGGESTAMDLDDEPAVVFGDDDDDAVPAYLDDGDEDEIPTQSTFSSNMWGNTSTTGFQGIGASPGLGMGSHHFSFFSQNTWMMSRKVQEWGDDPTIAARLAAAKQKDEDRRQESQSKLGRLSSWLRGG